MIIILGILAVVTVPKFIDVSEEANQAVVKGTSGALQSSIDQVKALWQARLGAETLRYEGQFESGNEIVNFSATGIALDASDQLNGQNTTTGSITNPNSNRCGRIWNFYLNYKPNLHTNGEGDLYYASDSGVFKIVSPTGTAKNVRCKYALMADENLIVVFNTSTGKVNIEGI